MKTGKQKSLAWKYGFAIEALRQISRPALGGKLQQLTAREALRELGVQGSGEKAQQTPVDTQEKQ